MLPNGRVLFAGYRQHYVYNQLVLLHFVEERTGFTDAGPELHTEPGSLSQRATQLQGLIAIEYRGSGELPGQHHGGQQRDGHTELRR